MRILVLADEMRTTGPAPRTRLLVDALAADADVVLVAQCYLPAGHRARRQGFAIDTYGFAAEGYDEKVVAYAADLVARHAPDVVVAHGWTNAKLVVALDDLDVPLLAFVDHATNDPTGEGQLNRIFRHAHAIVLHETIPPRLTLARWGLDARDVSTIDTSLDAILARRGLFARLRGDCRVESLGAGTADLHRLMNSFGPIVADVAADGPVRRRQRALDRATIEASGLFDRALHEPDDSRTPTQAVDAYLRASRLAVPRDRVLAGRIVRRPAAGFNPLVYATDQPGFDEATGADPFAHWLRAGRPAGRWTHDVIAPVAPAAAAAAARVALHLHLHYTDMLGAFLDRLTMNATAIDLFVTTTSDDAASEIERTLIGAGLEPKALSVVANHGRDLWPFLALLGDGVFDAYDVVGHFHGKRSPHMEAGAGWRDFLWRHLVGGNGAMLDAVAARIAADPTLGLVFAEDPHLDGWELNKGIATEIADGAGLETPLPNHFDYPMGTMFWARPAGLAPLRDLRLKALDIPPEPLPIDGTLLHALERLLPFVVEKAGYRCATTRVPEARR